MKKQKVSTKHRYAVVYSKGTYLVNFKCDADDLANELRRRGYKVRIKKLR